MRNQATQLLVHAMVISCLDNCNESAVKPLQTVQNAAAPLVSDQAMLAYRATSSSAPIYLNSIIQTYVPSRPMRSSKDHHHLWFPDCGTSYQMLSEQVLCYNELYGIMKCVGQYVLV